MHPMTICSVLSLALIAGASPFQNNPFNKNNPFNRGGKGQSTTSISNKGATVTSSAANSVATGSANNGTVSTGSANNGAAGDTGDPQTSLFLDPKVVSKGFENNGQDVPTAGQIASRVSSNNFINDCLNTPNLPLTNGQQITTGSCNNAPIGVIPSTSNMPSAKFSFPTNFGTVTADQTFTVQLNVQNIELGNFVNAKENYFAAPQKLNGQGQIIGHTHITIDPLPSLDATQPTEPLNFAYFKGVDQAAVNGAVSVTLDKGLPAGAYRLCTINSSANHQPVIVAIAQHGSLDDCVYFSATADGQAAQSGSADTAVGAVATATSVASSKATTKATTGSKSGNSLAVAYLH
ncbi:hypothetical protein C8J56DRAFT_1014222 [Mycena floridula]|nr:hypothetical protein C8J56DRAFT_1014222 [Mycena floridula]